MADMLSQDEIDALLGGPEDDSSADNSDAPNGETSGDPDVSSLLTDEEKDVLGEIGNISMGTSATTLFTLLNQKVLITTPHVEVINWSDLSKSYTRPCVGITVGYCEGLEGTNVMVLKQHDVKIISSLMMGGDGIVDPEEEVNEIDLSAIAEAMNQMVGSASTSLSSLVKRKIDILSPKAFIMDFAKSDYFSDIGFGDEGIVCTSFRMEIGTLIDSKIIQILPVEFAKQMVESLKDEMKAEQALPVANTSSPAAPASPPPAHVPERQPIAPPQGQYMQQPQEQYTAPPGGQYIAPPQQIVQPVNVAPAQFQNFDYSGLQQQKENIDIIMDVPLEVSVELGRSHKLIKDILEFAPGTILELNKMSSEPIDVLVNGKFVAKGEVVVIDENFGIRITDIISAEHRI